MNDGDDEITRKKQKQMERKSELPKMKKKKT